MDLTRPKSRVAQLKLFLGCLFMLMLIFSKYATSSCIILFIILAFYNVFYPDGKWNPVNAKKQAIEFFKNPAFWAITLIFWVTVLGFFNSDNLDYWISKVRIRLPFIALPVVFFFLPWDKNEKNILIVFSVILIALVSTGVVINYILNYEALNELLKGGRSLPVPMQDHIRYAQLQAFIFLSGLYYLIDNKGKSKLKYWILGLLLLIFIYLHVIAVRSGIFIAYIGLVSFLLLYIRRLNYRQILFVIGISISIPLIALKTLPSLKTRIGYSIWEWNEFRRGSSINNSDSGRWISYDVGLEYFKREPIVGIGPGDLEDEMLKTYSAKYPEEKVRKQPHNQFLHTLACSGIVGFIIFMSSFIISMFYAFRQRNEILIIIILATFTSFMVESPLEIARGTALIGFFLCFWTDKRRKEEVLTK